MEEVPDDAVIAGDDSGGVGTDDAGAPLDLGVLCGVVLP
mgnify:CR=1 FL=1